MDMLLENWFCFFLIVSRFRVTTAVSAWGFFRRSGAVGEYSCANSTVFNEEGFVSDIQCAVKCFGVPTCFATVYEPTAHRCVGCNIEFDFIGSGTAGYQFLRPFKVMKESKSWFESKDDCEQLGAQLAVIKSQHQHDDVANLLAMSGAERVWIGASDMDLEGTFVWLDGALVSDGYENWKDENPNDYQPFGQDCLTMQRQENDTYLLNDFHCERISMWALCEFN